MTIIFIFILGLAIGSFLNVCIDRLPHDETLQGRSHCDHCRKKLQGLDLIPVVSYLMLGGKCRYCKKKLSAFYPFVELLTGLSFVLVWPIVIASPTKYGAAISNILEIASSLNLNIAPRNDVIVFFIMAIGYFGIVSSLIVIFFADFKYRIIPDQATIALFIFSLPFVWIQNPTFAGVMLHFWGGVILFAILFAIYHGSIFFMKREGMGFGDVKLAFAMGFLLGVKAGLIGLYLSFILGGIVSVFLILFGKKGMKSMVAFGPFMVAGLVLMLFFQEKIFAIVRTILPL